MAGSQQDRSAHTEVLDEPVDANGKTMMMRHPVETDAVAGPGESSIEDYMAALIERTQMTPSIRDSDKLPRITPSMTVPEEQLLPSDTSVAPKDVPPVPMGPDDELPSGQIAHAIPEDRTAFSEMRELANMSARSSIMLHRGQYVVFAMYNKLIVALVAIVVSFALSGLAESTSSPAFYAATIAAIVAIVWCLQYFKLSRQLSDLAIGDAADEGDVD